MITKAFEKYRLNQYQPIIGIVLLLGLIFWGFFLNGTSSKLPWYLAAGLIFGYVLTRSRFGFAGGVKRIFYRGEGSLSKALIFLFALTALINIGIQWYAASNGAVPAWLASPTQSIIPGTQNVRIGNISVILGAFLFGMGMIMAGGCASGTLSDVGEGEGHAWVAFPFFVLFAAPGQWLGYKMDQTSFGKIGINAWLPQYVGYAGAILITLLAMFLLYLFVKWYENRKKANNAYLDPKGDWIEYEQPIEDDLKTPFNLMSWKTYHKFFVERWSFITGAVGITVGATIVLTTTGKAWGVTTPFVTLDQKFFQLFGINFTGGAFDETAKAMSGALLEDGGTIRNIGIVAGALIAFLLAGRFKMRFKMHARDFFAYASGGALMGLGSRIAKGCNIGALYSSITNFSVHGYIFMLFLILGAAFAIKLFQGKIDITPKYKKKN